ncbi:carboxylate/amino acid/amine transporter [Plesiomonas shigelloides]|uniref:carboxylate/amino acid/amine transporter n=1 Tax=Plesiomonas shigelloides TaxID=703 RepID=UPI000D90A453|nr:carboxylate/amino acid/amine transporter [Plesiomonas shigelloides]SPZ16987.1 carboxylate/amino acid/amine transporter [Plesiomonas shigelloides]
MLLLILTTLLWAFSFSLIGVYLAGQVDTWFSVLMRVLLALLVMLPFLRPRLVPMRDRLTLMALGACQLGIMYLFYYHAFLLLTVPEVVLFTILTPLYVTLIYDLLQRRFSRGYFVSAALAVAGALVIRYGAVSSQFILGFLVVQAANICFAIGQVGYKYWVERQPQPISQHAVFAWFYAGASVVGVIAFALFGDLSRLPHTPVQWGVLMWLGLVASGLGYFMWNKGATQVDTGTLAVMNNALVPAGLLVNFALWNQHPDWLRLAAGGILILLSLQVSRYFRLRSAPVT